MVAQKKYSNDFKQNGQSHVTNMLIELLIQHSGPSLSGTVAQNVKFHDDKKLTQKKVINPPFIWVYHLEKKDDGKKVLITQDSLKAFKEYLAEHLGLLPRLHPTHGLVTPDGVPIKDLSELRDGGKYVAIKAGYEYKKEYVPAAAFIN